MSEGYQKHWKLVMEVYRSNRADWNNALNDVWTPSGRKQQLVN